MRSRLLNGSTADRPHSDGLAAAGRDRPGHPADGRRRNAAGSRARLRRYHRRRVRPTGPGDEFTGRHPWRRRDEARTARAGRAPQASGQLADRHDQAGQDALGEDVQAGWRTTSASSPASSGRKTPRSLPTTTPTKKTSTSRISRFQHVQKRVAALYAKNPRAVAKKRQRLMATIWDGSLESLGQAEATIKQAQAALMGMPAGVPGMPPGGPPGHSPRPVRPVRVPPPGGPPGCLPACRMMPPAAADASAGRDDERAGGDGRRAGRQAADADAEQDRQNAGDPLQLRNLRAGAESSSRR